MFAYVLLVCLLDFCFTFCLSKLLSKFRYSYFFDFKRLFRVGWYNIPPKLLKAVRSRFCGVLASVCSLANNPHVITCQHSCKHQ